jgi:hypothetical protein
VVTTIAGSGEASYADSTGTNASFIAPSGIVLTTNSNIYVADSGNYRIRMVTPGGVVTTLAGNELSGFANGIGSNALFNNPYSLTIDQGGNILVSDYGNHRIRKISFPNGIIPNGGMVTTIAGYGGNGFSNGIGVGAYFNCPVGITINSGGDIFVADSANNMIRKLTLGSRPRWEYVAFCKDGGAHTLCLTSYNGQQWKYSLEGTSDKGFNGITSGFTGTYVALYIDSVKGQFVDFYVSTDDAQTWTSVTAPIQGILRGITYGPTGGYVAVGDTDINGGTDSLLLRSSDGIGWTGDTGPIGATIMDVAYGPIGGYVAVGYLGDDSIYLTSSNGESWTGGTGPIQATLTGITYGPRCLSMSYWSISYPSLSPSPQASR